MEKLAFAFGPGARQLPHLPQIVGVAGSGNLEILLEAADLNGMCEIEVATPARGFDAIWDAVLEDCCQRWQPANLRIAINDVGATPAVVSLRLDQALQAASGEA
ncbi:malonate decarboxylase acyl carrier protein [Massilia sp. W12]|uniref:malonate decarboxylase acyl carrier protein n=1 Tax=Massilia sp. W12 TaxID=3126507 RepID=UPI0030D2D28D